MGMLLFFKPLFSGVEFMVKDEMQCGGIREEE